MSKPNDPIVARAAEPAPRESSLEAHQNVREALAHLERWTGGVRRRRPAEVTDEPETEAGLAGQCFRRVSEILDARRRR